MSKIKSVTPSFVAGSKVKIGKGTQIKTNQGYIKADRDMQVTVAKVETTPAGNTKITWKGHRSMKSAIIKS